MNWIFGKNAILKKTKSFQTLNQFDKESNWIFGYGSLINKESRNKTGQSGEVIPVRVMDIKRQWSLVVEEMNLTASGAIYSKGSICNGIIYQVDESELPKFDAREIPFGYSRIALNKREIKALMGYSLPQGIFWVYVANNPSLPSRKNSIIQSYIDVILTGCLDYSEDFAREFIQTTEFWEYPWVNDRAKPVYPRAMKNPNIKKIDQMLREEVPREFGKRM